LGSRPRRRRVRREGGSPDPAPDGGLDRAQPSGWRGRAHTL